MPSLYFEFISLDFYVRSTRPVVGKRTDQIDIHELNMNLLATSAKPLTVVGRPNGQRRESPVAMDLTAYVGGHCGRFHDSAAWTFVRVTHRG
jgi:hypothetical protein